MHKDGSLDSLLRLCWHGGGWGPSLFCGAWLISEEIFSKSFLCCSAGLLPGPWIRKKIFVVGKGGSSVPISISDVLASLATAFKHMRQNKNLRKWPLCWSLKARTSRDLPVVQWLRVGASTAGGRGQPLAGARRSHVPWTQSQGFQRGGLQPVCPLSTLQSLLSLIYT